MLVRARLSSKSLGNSSVGTTGFWPVPDEIERVCAPPALCATPVRGSGVADEFCDIELRVNDGECEPDGEFVADELEEGFDGPFCAADEEPDEPGDPEDEELDEEPESDGCAMATPGIVATADPTPSATASAPTRPM